MERILCTMRIESARGRQSETYQVSCRVHSKLLHLPVGLPAWNVCWLILVVCVEQRLCLDGLLSVEPNTELELFLQPSSQRCHHGIPGWAINGSGAVDRVAGTRALSWTSQIKMLTCFMNLECGGMGYGATRGE